MFLLEILYTFCMRNFRYIFSILIVGIFTNVAAASILPLGSLTLERRINPVSNEFDVIFIAQNLSGNSGYTAESIVFNNAFFLVDNSDKVIFNPGFVEGPDGEPYDGFDYTTGVDYPLNSNQRIWVAVDEDFFNLSDPYWLRLGFKSNETELVILEVPFAYGDKVLLYAVDSNGPIPPEVTTGVKAPKSPRLPNSPNLGALFSPISPKSPNAPRTPNSPNLMSLSASFQDGEIPTTTNPEPATMLLFGGGIAGAILRRRKLVQ